MLVESFPQQRIESTEDQMLEYSPPLKVPQRNYKAALLEDNNAKRKNEMRTS